MPQLIDNESFRKILITTILIVLIVVSFLILEPILLSLISGIILAVVFSKPYEWIMKKTGSRNASLAIICVLIASIIILPIWFLTPIFLRQSFQVYISAQQVDLSSVFDKLFPSVSGSISTGFSSVLSSFITKTLNSLTTSVSDLILNFPTIFLHLIVVFSTFFFVLRDKDEIILYIKSVTPFSKEVEKKLFDSSRGIILSVVYGQIIIGIIQGLVASIGFFIFQAPNPMFLALIAIIAGILPIVGPLLVCIPVIFYFLIAGNTFAAFGIGFFGVLSSSIDNVLRPWFVSKSSNLHPLLSLVGMVGGFFFFGILGFVIGPVVLAFVFIILEIYRGRELPGFFLAKQQQ